MKISTKLMTGFGLLLVLMFVLAGLGMSRLSAVNESMDEMFVKRYEKVRLAYSARSDVNTISKYMANLLLNPDPNMPGAKDNVEKSLLYLEQLNQGIAQLLANTKTDAEKQLAYTTSQNGEKFTNYVNQALELYKQGNVEAANKLRNATGVLYQDQVIANLDQITDYHNDSVVSGVNEFRSSNSQTLMFTALITIAALIIGLGVMYWIIRSLSRGLALLTRMIQGFANGKFDPGYRIEVTTTDEFGKVADVFNGMADGLETLMGNERALSKINEEQAWLKSNVANMSVLLQDQTNMHELTKSFVTQSARMIGASYGSVYLLEREGMRSSLVLAASYAFDGDTDSNPAEEFALGQGLVGQVASDGQRILIEEEVDQQVMIRSSFGQLDAKYLIVEPVEADDEICAVVEFAGLKKLSEGQINLLEQLSENLAVSVSRIRSRERVEELLRMSQALTEELQSQSEELISQQEELRTSNEKLEEQTKALKASEELLQSQQEELEQNNSELLRKTKQLEIQVQETELANRQIEEAKEAIEKQAFELAMASRYKSEFLANMSHELRTPLNSMLILSQMLAENKEGNLKSKQVEYADTIHSSGSDLLKLINDVLDLSKVEAGKIDIQTEYVLLPEVMETIERSFDQIARKKGLGFEVKLDSQVPRMLYTDNMRLEQILRNLLSNAFKFTSQGSVLLHVYPVDEGESQIAFSVKDTGIGIPEEKQLLIFEAFQQADGTTSRQFGGTGLGLSISRQLASLLGGNIEICSREGEGSTFTLFIPNRQVSERLGGTREAAAAGQEQQEAFGSENEGQRTSQAQPLSIPMPKPPKPASKSSQREVEDDRGTIEESDKVLLIVEDDVHFVQVLVDMARNRGFKVLVAMQGDIGLQMAREYKPDGILLDIQLPIVDGWSILVQLKNNADTRHIPVHVMSVVDEVHQGLSMGAIAYMRKPSSKDLLEQAFSDLEGFIDQSLRKLLLVEDDPVEINNLIELIRHDDVIIDVVSSADEAMEKLQEQHFDCMVLDVGLADKTAFDLLDQIKGDENLRRLPIVMYTQKEYDKKDEMRLKKYAESIIIKNVKSPERLLDETALFLHRVEDGLPEEKKQILQRLHSSEAVFSGKKVLLVDDDIRNVFALSNLLEGYNMKVLFAETGRQALSILDREPDIDLVLMDIMMPEMDGYEAMREIRNMPHFDHLPIIALTAKAMRDDREKCIAAGASDYITKPINNDQLMSLIRVWLFK
ncbi:response regulator [Paenibacillus lutrae]|uniref:Circadian input-output histidine kinase CikA n=1 Tax=Paenibacillus lutrae TaxID=2078573 RepID=A0A7X3JZF0_9BACL|nr:response regulator [Paenibacillus lutrae]MVO99976.1 response regulator [Paenibacillus lutrae]